MRKTLAQRRALQIAQCSVDNIALCSGQNDRGVFELTYNGERYLPFEGAGAISTWRLELQPDIRPFDYDTLMDVRIHTSHVANLGDEIFKSAAAAQVKTYAKTEFDSLDGRDGQFLALELSRDFADQWYRATQTTVTGACSLVATCRAAAIYSARAFAGAALPNKSAYAPFCTSRARPGPGAARRRLGACKASTSLVLNSSSPMWA